MGLIKAIGSNIGSKLKNDFTNYRNYPVEFAYDVLRVDYLTPQQIAILRMIAKDDVKFTAIQAGHSLGKTWILAVITLWFLYSRKPSRIQTTASSAAQVEGILWKYIATFHSKAQLTGDLLKTRLTLGTADNEPDWFAQGLTAKDSTGFQGRHSPNYMVIFDEAVEILKEFWNAGKSMCSSPTDKFLAIGNPTTTDCEFYEQIMSGLWNIVVMSCYDHPNVTGDTIVVEGAVTKEWIRDMIKDCGGVQTGEFRSRVLGLFPITQADQIIQDGWIEACSMLDYDYTLYKNIFIPSVVALDASGGGDDTVICEIYDDGFTHFESFSGYNESDATNYLKANYDKDVLLVIDDIGVGGMITQELSNAGHNVMPFVASEAAENKTIFFNKRSEAFYQARNSLKDGVVKLDKGDTEFKRQMLAFRQMEWKQWRLETKDKTKARLKTSPNIADAFIMANHHFVLNKHLWNNDLYSTYGIPSNNINRALITSVGQTSLEINDMDLFDTMRQLDNQQFLF
jgi:hypothetical protein